MGRREEGSLGEVGEERQWQRAETDNLKKREQREDKPRRRNHDHQSTGDSLIRLIIQQEEPIQCLNPVIQGK